MQTDESVRQQIGLGGAYPRLCVSLGLVCVLTLVTLLTGCGASLTSTGTPITVSAGLKGRLMGGNQPIGNANIQLFVPGTAGYGSASLPILNTTVYSDAAGNFQLTGEFTCPAPSSPVYMLVTGGNPGLAPGTNNAAIGLMALLGPCGGLLPTSYIVINELTTVAAVWTMAPFMVDGTHIGTSPTNVQGLLNAAAAGTSLVNVASGTTPGNAPSIATIPTAEISTLADVLSTCVNSNGSTSPLTACGRLFTAVTPSGGVTPSDTIAAALDIAQSPGHNVGSIFNTISSGSPFQPTLPTTPNDWTIAINYVSPVLQNPADLAIDQQGNAWVVSSANGVNSTVSILNTSGITASYVQTGANYGHIALDSYGDPWLTNTTNSTVLELTSAGTRASSNPFSGGGISGPGALAFDAFGNVWIANSGPTVSKLSANGAPISPSTGYSTGGSSGPGGLALDTTGKVWIADSGANAVEVLGNQGQQVSGSPYTGGGLDGPYAIAIDTTGGAWVANRTGGGSLTRVSSSGGAISGSPFYGGGLSAPIAISMDGLANVWVVNSGSNSVSEFLSNGQPQSGAAGYASAALAQPYKAALDASGNVWVTNLGTAVAGTGTVTQIVGVGSPVTTPASLAIQNNALDQRP